MNPDPNPLRQTENRLSYKSTLRSSTTLPMSYLPTAVCSNAAVVCVYFLGNVVGPLQLPDCTVTHWLWFERKTSTTEDTGCAYGK